MKYLTYLLSVYCLIGCGNKKEKIVEEIKKAKNEHAWAKLNHGNYKATATHLLQYNNSTGETKAIYKEAFDKDKEYLKGVPSEVLNDYKKLDSIALIWEWEALDAQKKIDSLELELKKY